ncbi:phage minor capsid protein [Prescottella agglutinans]|uniref:ADP ribosyltransferase domain-containing protein n=1 Tax=Prescottella agglutinans TaxID=1644129 RepID=A0ABT6MES0_9NOCA|nr:phage minor capsid protein [Prescottella agglutinans]MDH6282813.1 hypothetical protein [Prescottella agglutinans]
MPLTPSFGDKLAARVTNLYAAAEEKLIRYVAGKVTGDLDQPQSGLTRLALRIGPVRRAVARILDNLRSESRVRVSEAMREAMENGRQAAIDDLTPTVRVPVYPVDGASAQRAEALNRKLEQPLERAKLVTENAYQRIIREATAGQKADSKAARKRLVQRALDKFAAEGISGFIDKRGRSYDLVTYAEMAVRTAITEAEVSAYLAQARHAGLDLVIISDVPQSCELCRPFEGKLLSITGTTRGAITTNPATGRSERVRVYASIEEAKARGLWHPGCRHVLKIWTPEDPAPPDDSPPDPEGYRATQKLRYLERRVRRWKRVLAAAQSPEAEAAAKRHIRAAQADIRRHIAATGVSRDRDREQLHRGYRDLKMAAGAEDTGGNTANEPLRSVPGGGSGGVTPSAPTPSPGGGGSGGGDGDDPFGFNQTPLAEDVLRGQRPDLLTESEAGHIEAYAISGFRNTNRALRGEIEMTPTIQSRVDAIRSALSKYPLPQAVRVTREVDARLFNLVGADSIDHLIGEQVVEPGFMSTSVRPDPPHSAMRPHPAILELIVPRGTPALRLGGLAEIPDEAEALIIDGQAYEIVGGYLDQRSLQLGRRVWRLQAVVSGGEIS